MAGHQRLPLVPPMLATAGSLPDADGWASEFKLDGLRAVAYLDDGSVVVRSRNDLDISSQYPELGVLSSLARRGLVLDGEIVALDDAGVPQFARLQRRMHVTAPSAPLLRATPVTFYLFDLLAIDGESTVALSYLRRRALLNDLGLNVSEVRVLPTFTDAEPADIYKTAVEAGLEGVVCKRLTSTYQPGHRSRDWIKVPIVLAQDVVVVGWQAGNGRRGDTIGALHLAVHAPDGGLVYVGKVGTGFTDAALRHLAAVLAPLAIGAAPVNGVPRDMRGAHWTRPTLVGEVAFRNWTPDRRLRHVSWRGLRPDKDPDDVFSPGSPRIGQRPKT